MTGLIQRMRRSKALIRYFLLTYVDKIISFVLPLSVLFFIQDKDLYAFIEVAFSYAILVGVVIDCGFSSYLFFGYRNAEDKTLFLKEATLYFKLALLCYMVICIPVIFLIYNFSTEQLALFVAVLVRTFYTFFTTFYANVYRLEDSPARIYRITLFVNIASFGLLMISYFFDLPHKVVYFFLPSALLVFGVTTSFAFIRLKEVKLSRFFDFVKDALRFAWPIILNVLTMSFINNYAKIYSNAYLTQDDTIQISFIMRVGLIIQLTHSAFSSYFSKQLFMDKERKFNAPVFIKYNLILISAIFTVLLIIFLSSTFFVSFVYIPLSASTFLFVLYIVLWCYIGYFELYFGVMNANRKILYYSLFSSAIYLLLLLFSSHITLLKLAVFMTISVAINLLMVMFGLSKIGVLNTVKKSTV